MSHARSQRALEPHIRPIPIAPLLLAGYALWAGLGVARAAPPREPVESPAQVILWGVQRGCDADVAAERAVVERLESFAGRPVGRVRVPAQARYLNCIGASCAKLLHKSCAGLTGQLIGGEVDELISTRDGAPAVVARLRVWRYDLATGETYYLYGLCPRGVCGDLSVREKLADMASHLVERPAFAADNRSPEEVLASRLPLCAAIPARGLAGLLPGRKQEDLCQPFPQPRCLGAALSLTRTWPTSGGKAAGISPGVIKGTQGVLWGLFAVSAAAAATLFALNATDLGTESGSTYGVSNTLERPAWAAVGFSALTLAVAIPMTIALSRSSAAAGARDVCPALVASPQLTGPPESKSDEGSAKRKEE